TNNVCGTVGATTPFLRDFGAKHGLDAVFSEFSLDSAEVVEIPKISVYSSHLQQGLDPDHAERQGVSAADAEVYQKSDAYAARLVTAPLKTCGSCTVGTVWTKGVLCAWMESSAVIYMNSVLRARTKAEGRECVGAARLTGKSPYWRSHLDENRLGTQLVEV